MSSEKYSCQRNSLWMTKEYLLYGRTKWNFNGMCEMGAGMGVLTVFLSIKGLINKAGRGSWDIVSNPNMMALTICNRKGQFF